MTMNCTVYNNYSLEQSFDDEWFKLNYEFFANFTSKHTQMSYKNDLKQFFDFTKNTFSTIKTINDIARVHIIAYKSKLIEQDLAPKTVNRKLSSISSYMDFLVDKGVINNNYVSTIKRPKQEAKNPTNDLTDEQITALFNSVSKNKSSAPLHRAILYLLFTTGIRKSELIGLKRADYKRQGEHHIINIRAKGGKYLTKVIPPITVAVIEDYLLWMNKKGRKHGELDWLFSPTKNPHNPTNLNKSLTPKAIDYILAKYCKLAGISERISAHSARASYIGSALEAGVDMWRVAKDVGHSSVKTTEMYNKRRSSMDESPAYSLTYLKEHQK